MVQKTKTENFDKIRNIIRNLDKDSFTNYDIEKLTGMHYNQIKRLLQSLQELNEVKYLESSKIYVRISKNEM